MTSGNNVMDADMDCGGFFDHIDDFLDVPNDNVPIDLDSFPGIGSGVGPEIDKSPPEAFPCSDSVFSGSSEDISAELSVPYEDIVQLEWLSSFFEDSFSGGLTVDKPTKVSPGNHLSDHRFRTSSPVSVMDSSSSCSAVKTSTITIAPSRCGRARTKRPRPKIVNYRPITVPPPASGSETCVESRLVIKIPKESSYPKHKYKKKNKKFKFTLPDPTPTDGDHDPPSQPIRKCLHCEITKTPQWRAGPMGPKTLCNACGVRNKLGRLFPEYRPAASPTSVPTLHSNSHKKVLEMRNKVGGGRAANGIIGGSAVIERIPNARVAMDCV